MAPYAIVTAGGVAYSLASTGGRVVFSAANTSTGRTVMMEGMRLFGNAAGYADDAAYIMGRVESFTIKTVDTVPSMMYRVQNGQRVAREASRLPQTTHLPIP